MKILLVGEYSNVHSTLSAGLKTEGEDVSLASDGDGLRNFDRDFNLNVSSYFDRVYFRVRKDWIKSIPSIQFIKLKSILENNEFDVVQLHNPFFIHDSPDRIAELFELIKKRSNKVFLAGYGDDSYYVKACVEGRFKYSVLTPLFRNAEIFNKYLDSFNTLKDEYFALNKLIANEVSGIIPAAVEYAIAYKIDFNHKVFPIPFPINTDVIQPINQHVEKRKKFLHFKQKEREHIKGTSAIIETFDRLAEAYPGAFSLEVKSHQSFTSWKASVKESNFIADQIYSYSQGMSALQAMAMGRPCLSGCEREYL